MKTWLIPTIIRSFSKHWQHYRIYAIGIFLFCLISFLTITTYAQSQTDIPSYWQYSASGRVQHVLVTDINLDGIDDFIAADGNGRLEMIDASGTPQWRYVAPGNITSINATNVIGTINSPLEVLVGVPNKLILLSSEGDEIWRTQVTPQLEPPSRPSGGPPETAGAWAEDQVFLPVSIAPIDQDNDGLSEIMLLLQSGHLMLYNSEGKVLWQETRYGSNPENVSPKMIILDLDRDGQDEILFSVFNPRRFGQLIFIDDGEIMWEIPVSGRITDLAEIDTNGGHPPLVAISTSLGHIQVFDHLRRQSWLRTLNQPITSIEPFPTPDGVVLAAGTSVGMVVAYDQEGRRMWDTKLAEDADRQILAISTSSETLPTSQPSLAITLESADNAATAADLFMLDREGLIISKIPNVDTLGLTRFVDSNHDKNNELLVGHFATLELLGLGVGNNENVREWEYTLDAVPSAVLVADFDDDSREEMVIGTQNGRIHSLNADRSIRWLHDVGGAITNLAVLPRPSGIDDDIIVVRQGDKDVGASTSAWIELREAKGERIWELELDSPVTSLLVANLENESDYEIIIGTEDSQLLLIGANGDIKSEISPQELDGPIKGLELIKNEDGQIKEIVAASDQDIIGINLQDEFQPLRPIASFDSSIMNVFAVQDIKNDELDIRLVVPTSDQTVHGLNWRGIEMAHWLWPQFLDGVPITSTSIRNHGIQAQDRPSFLMGIDSGQMIQLDIQDNQPVIPWQIEGIGNTTVLHWRDQDGDSVPDLRLAGTDDGKVWIFSKSDTSETNPLAAPLDLSSSVFALESINREDSQTPDLLTITENGLIQLFREQENRPPLLTNPVAEVDGDQYTISVAVSDVEFDEVAVQLEIQDSESGDWIPYEVQRVINGIGTLFWTPASAPPSPVGLNYRFAFTDGSNEGILAPPIGPSSGTITPLVSVFPSTLFVVGLLGLVIAVVFIRQSQTPNAQARRFYRKLKQHPIQSLTLLEQKYVQIYGSTDFLLHLSNQSRQAEDPNIADLAQGLFLLDDRPQSGLSILKRTVSKIEDQEKIVWDDIERLQLTIGTCQLLLDAPSITELSLLLPQLVQLIDLSHKHYKGSSDLALLKPILTNLRDSERVDLVEDRLVYLNEAKTQCRQLYEQLPEHTPSIERTVAISIIRRWMGLVSAEIEDLRGRAQLIVSLITKRLVPTQHTVVALEIRNKGRSAAENVIVTLDNDPAYINHSPPNEIAFLPPGQSREVRFTIEPQVIDRFRIGFTITYDDRNKLDKAVAFGDMVHLLPPTRDFSPIPNPYTPGTPLRPDSLLFFGREDLFDFIAENSGYRSFRNVLILVGQRRTGKTSALLRLEDHLPEHLMAVYIDCQSLGVIAGMPALLEEFAWTIADAMSRRGLTVEVPDLDQWQKDPTRLFQRRFLPQVKSLLPPDSTLLLVFDEFEAFENLVADGILPPTFFTYLRHLMQHGEQLNFIFVGTRRLEEMTSDYWSVLFNIALYRKIDFLTTQAAVRLIMEPVAPDLVYDDLAIDKILRVTAGHPYFLQLVCYTLVKRANSQRTGYVTISDVNAAVDEMLSLGEVHFAYLWQRSTATERALLTAVAHLMDQNAPFYPEELLSYLEPYYPQPDPVEVTSALNRLVERDVLQEVTEEAKTLYELKLGLVGSWVAKNKSLSKLYAGNGSSRSGLTVDEQTA